MDKATISFKANDDQQLIRVGALRTFASDTIDYIEAHFDLAPFWREGDKLYAAWYCDKSSNAEFTDIPESGIVRIPDNLLKKPGKLKMNIVASKYRDPEAEEKIVSYRMTSYPVDVLVIEKARIPEGYSSES